MESITNYTREDALKANEEKMKIEAEISDWKSVLDSEGNVGMDGKLVDEEGYPRNDIDIPKVRMARQKIICLSNDHKAIMKKIETILIHLHAQQDNQTEDSNSSRTAQPMEQDLPEPFAKVEFVNIGSPAHDCGMRAGDLVVEFGTQNNSNFKSLMDIGQLVQNSQNRNVRIKLIRNRQLVTLNLVPKLWQGVGLLGCKMVPLNVVL
jgi:26S proteasome non-ATPase regulatory subunit 9